MIEEPIRAILVSVDYADLLAVTLPYNRHHFDDVMVVTSPEDTETMKVISAVGAQAYLTSDFYENGAIFNKWLALENALDVYGRHGWMCIMDADVLWPRIVPDYPREIGHIYTPYRRMFVDTTQPIPGEENWKAFPRHRVKTEWSGYSQIFHADDPCLGCSPWHQTNWTHAGGADSFFQQKWLPKNKHRPPFEVLHIGSAGANWCGRSTPMLDGSSLPEAESRQQMLTGLLQERRRRRTYDHEKIQ